MNRLIIDIETNAIYDWENLTDLKTIHCISILDDATGTMRSYNSQTPGEIEEAMAVIGAADVIVGHNAIRFDWPALLKMDSVRSRYSSHGKVCLP